MNKTFTNHITFGVAATALSFALCATLCVFFIAADHLTLIEFRKALLREQWFWYAVIVCVVLSFFVRCMWPRLNAPRSEIFTNFEREVRRESTP
ncbi:hypothetical protein PsaNZ64_27700 [Pseudomonas syringae pv. actinidiae]|uniref:Uncharacterized protein n=1 Tax=Pseudomonas syringae pv. actinidiae TaxID=103796 RepID=A0A2P0QFX9_PSESF|nr:hypothetical protein [Pseudomonas syringae]ARO45298.1 hypothetical protein [Pseudomonas syringae pv. actinidiae]OKS65405.1 hypothetical protein PsaNZ64_27700 [Pseudomonas syringae pv. actinidiae]